MTADKQFGAPVDNWTPPAAPTGETLTGRYCELERLNPDLHANDLFVANSEDDGIWDYLPYGPFIGLPSYRRWITTEAMGDDPFFYAIKDSETGRFVGVASYLRINPAAGSIELGHINFSKPLQQTRAATEALFLMMQWAFDAGYRRFEWKCDALNAASRAAAQRLGLSFEGVFRQATIYKGRNRDTAWFAAIDTEWPELRKAFEFWLNPSNFTATGRQIESLRDLTRPIRMGSQ